MSTAGNLCSNGRTSLWGGIRFPDGDVLRAQFEYSGDAVLGILHQVVRDAGIFTTSVLYVVLQIHDAGLVAGNLRIQSYGFPLLTDHVLLQQADQIFEVHGYPGNGVRN